jgi:hypothetical protein
LLAQAQQVEVVNAIHRRANRRAASKRWKEKFSFHFARNVTKALQRGAYRQQKQTPKTSYKKGTHEVPSLKQITPRKKPERVSNSGTQR